MANYEDFKPEPGSSAADVYAQITNYLVGCYSVEILPDQNSVILRVWYDEHCDINQHNRL
jgi:hypothetical protein